MIATTLIRIDSNNNFRDSVLLLLPYNLRASAAAEHNEVENSKKVGQNTIQKGFTKPSLHTGVRLYQCIRQKIPIAPKVATAPLHLADESKRPTGTLPPKIIPCIPQHISIVGADIVNIKWPPALESDSGTVQDEIITRISPITAKNLPQNFDFPLTESHIPSSIAHKGTQNQMAASSIGFILIAATRGLINMTGITCLSVSILVNFQSVSTK